MFGDRSQSVIEGFNFTKSITVRRVADTMTNNEWSIAISYQNNSSSALADMTLIRPAVRPVCRPIYAGVVRLHDPIALTVSITCP